MGRKNLIKCRCCKRLKAFEYFKYEDYIQNRCVCSDCKSYNDDQNMLNFIRASAHGIGIRDQIKNIRCVSCKRCKSESNFKDGLFTYLAAYIYGIKLDNKIVQKNPLISARCISCKEKIKARFRGSINFKPGYLTFN